MSHELGVPVPSPSDGGRLNKRCRNALLRESGFELRYPSFRDGYPDIIRAFLLERGDERRRVNRSDE